MPLDHLELKWHDHEDEFCDQLKHLMNGHLSDVQLIIYNEDIKQVQKIKAHKIILSMASDYFKCIFDSFEPWEKSLQNHVLLLNKDFKVESVKILLEYIYCGSVKVNQSDLDQVIELAQFWGVKGLKDAQSDNQGSKRSKFSLKDAQSDSKRASKRSSFELIDAKKASTSQLSVIKSENEDYELDFADIDYENDDFVVEGNDEDIKNDDFSVENDDEDFKTDDFSIENEDNDEFNDFLPIEENEVPRKKRKIINPKATFDKFHCTKEPIEMDPNNPYDGNLGDNELTVLTMDESNNKVGKVAINGFIYQKNKSKETKWYFICWYDKCPGRLVTNNELSEFTIRSEHHHPPNQIEVDKFLLYKKMTQIATSNKHLLTSEIINEAIEGVPKAVVDALMGNKDLVYQNIRRRKKMAGFPGDMQIMQRRKKPNIDHHSKSSSSKKFLKDELKLTHIFPGDEGDNILELIPSKGGSSIAIMNGYIYTKSKTRGSDEGGKTYWTCRRKDCHGTMASDIHCLSGENKAGHYHDRDTLEIEKVRAIRSLKIAALSRRGEQPSVLVNEMFREISEELKKKLADKRSLGSSIIKWRKNVD